GVGALDLDRHVARRRREQALEAKRRALLGREGRALVEHGMIEQLAPSQLRPHHGGTVVVALDPIGLHDSFYPGALASAIAIRRGVVPRWCATFGARQPGEVRRSRAP